MLQKLSLIEMWHFAQNICNNVIPLLIAKQKNNDRLIDDVDDDPTIIQLRSNDIGNLQDWHTENPYIQDFYVPSELVYSLQRLSAAAANAT